MGLEVLFHGRRIDEEMGGLHQEELLVPKEKTHGAAQQIAGGHVVAVQNENQIPTTAVETVVDAGGLIMGLQRTGLAAAPQQAVVDVAGLGAVIRRPREVGDSQPGGDGLQVFGTLPRPARPVGVRII
jgi:hypothetical protein